MDNEIVLRIQLEPGRTSDQAPPARRELLLQFESTCTPVAEPAVRYTVQRSWRPRNVPDDIQFEFTEPEFLASGTGYLLRVLGEFTNLQWDADHPPVIQFMACYATIAECKLVPQAEPGTYRLGCHLSLFGLPLQTQIDLVLLIPGRGAVHFASIALTIQASLPPRSRFSPFFVNGPPRSGTTWLQSLLAAHPEIVAAGGYPFEQSHGIYWASMARTLTQPDLEIHSLRSSSNFSRSMPPSPFNPGLNDSPDAWFVDKYFQWMASFARSVTNAFYTDMATQKPAARFFVEKWPGHIVPYVARSLYQEVRELYLLRDPRDVVLSILRFNARRGFADFGVETLGDGEAFIAALARQLREELILFRQRTWDKSGIVLDYATLRNDPRGVLMSTLKLFGLAHAPEVVDAMLLQSTQTDMRRHVTSDGSAADINLRADQEQWIAQYFAGYRDW